ncbi:MAG: 50S ribosomal protein L21 [Alphaproteobacteria bacterium]|nr:50S ribosomal protein L21 [Alphaproteobacteria bacterium]
MFAVIKTGGKQYKVTTGDVVKVEKLNAAEGSEVIFDEVLALDEKIGKPFVKGASVKATVLKQAKDAKVIIFKKKRRQNYRRKNGHRQQITLVKILDVCAKDKEA